MSQGGQVLQTLRPVLASLAEAGLASCQGVLARIWLAGPADQCASCALRPECRSRTTCLHLVMSAGLTSRVDGPFRRFPIGARTVGRIPITHEPLIARDDLLRLGVADPAWLTLHGVRSLAALPLEHGVRCIGVLAVFSRGTLPGEQMRQLAAAAHLGAEAIGNVEAYRAMAAERNRLAAKHARLRSELGLLPQPTASPATAGPVAATGAMIHTDAAAAPLPSFAEIQRQAILRVLERTRWRVSGPKGAAEALGLKPTTLESKMKKLGIRRPAR